MRSWIGKHCPPCVSDVHDAVVVIGHYRFPSHAAAPQLLVAEAPLDFTQPVCAAAEEVSANISGDVHSAEHMLAEHAHDGAPKVVPAGRVTAETRVEERIPLEDIAQTLGAILEAAGCESGGISQVAAEDLINALVLNNCGLGLKHIDDVMTAMREPIFQRAGYVSYVATTYGVEERSAGAHRAASKSYTTEEWFDWYETHSLSDGAMDGAIQQWKAEFHCQQRETIATLEKEGSRASKKRARDLLNGAFKVYLRDVCGIRQVAIELLRNPTKDLERILWKRAQ